MPFVAGTVSLKFYIIITTVALFEYLYHIDVLLLLQSTSPSHSVHANVQSILHMMKHHQPQLCERVSALHRSGCGARKSLEKDFPPSSASFRKPDQSLGSLSDLLLALQDELGQMSL